LIKKKKQLSLARVLAFCKRLTTMALHSSPSTAVGYLSHLRLLLQDHSKADLLMDVDHFGAGTFLPDLEDPEFCNANATRVWELFLLKRHYHPKVEKFAIHHLNRLRHKNVKSELSIKAPLDLVGEMKEVDVVKFLDDLEKRQQQRVISGKKHVTRYSFIDSPESMTSHWFRTMLQEEVTE
jgi:nucleolar complex protein 3